MFGYMCMPQSQASVWLHAMRKAIAPIMGAFNRDRHSRGLEKAIGAFSGGRRRSVNELDTTAAYL